MSTRLYTAEVVFPGHPDKLCDAVADLVVQQCIRQHTFSPCGVEVSAYQRTVHVTGEIAAPNPASISVAAAVKDVWKSAGYGKDAGSEKEWDPDGESLNVFDSLKRNPFEVVDGECRWAANDQAVVTGYAIDIPETNYLPPEHWLALRLSRRLELLRTERPELFLGPDGKVQVIVKDNGPELELAAFNTSIQQSCEGSCIDLLRCVREVLEGTLATLATEYPSLRSDLPNVLHVNPRGNFEVGGTFGDSGLSGKKLVVDFYGPRVPIGGGALSGKDIFKPDRGGALLARKLAKAVVMTGAARECTATLAIFPAEGRFNVVSLRDGTGRELDAARWERFVDLSFQALDAYAAANVDWVGIARYGHFSDPGLPWEQVGL